jgi:hypothetical protein
MKCKSINSNKIGLPLMTVKDKAIRFKIFNMDVYPEFSGNYYGIVAFGYFSDYFMRNSNSNYLYIFIPELTNTFFQRYFIKGEYARIKNGILWWRGKYYEK